MTTNASPIQNSSLATSNSTITTPTLPNAGIFCSTSRAAQGDILACLKLLVELPESTSSGIFHNAGRDDEYQLPVSLATVGCQVDVTVAYGSQELSNWPAVRFAANQLIAACTEGGGFPYAETGGYARIGQSGNIRVTVNAAEGDLGAA